jgi:hypothetical protein
MHHEHDYALAFLDNQKLQLLHRKIMKALSILEASIETARSLRRLLQKVDSSSKTHDVINFEGIECYLARLVEHRRVLRMLRDRSSETSKLVSMAGADPHGVIAYIDSSYGNTRIQTK